MSAIKTLYEHLNPTAADIFDELFQEDAEPYISIDGDEPFRRSLCVTFNSKAIQFQILSQDGAVERQNTLKLSLIANVAKTYVEIIKAIYANQVPDEEVADTIRGDLHKAMATQITDKLEKIGISFTKRDSKDDVMQEFSRDIITCWFDQIGYAEKIGAITPHATAGSFLLFHNIEDQVRDTGTPPASKIEKPQI